MLIFDEFRRAAADGSAGLFAEDFVTEFGKKVFCVLCELENSEYGYSQVMLNQYFVGAEYDLLQRIEIDRRQLARNDRAVFDACIAGLKAEKKKLEQSSDPFADLKAKREAAKMKKNKEN
jgi:hypothetical protein